MFILPVSADHLPIITTSSEDIAEIVISPEGIVSLLQILKSEKMTGPDGIANHMLKQCSGMILCFLSILLENSP